MDEIQNKWIKGLRGSWPSEWEHCLSEELLAFENGDTCSLPFLSRGKGYWITLSPTGDKLRETADYIRAWLMPSYAWEDQRGAFVSPDEAGTKENTAILTYSPTGYYRWCCKEKEFKIIQSRLQKMRELQANRPSHTEIRAPSLSLLRQQFTVALVGGDRTGAQDIINEIDRHKLDDGVNTSIMKVQMWGNFREFQQICSHSQVGDLIKLPLPNLIRQFILEAFHEIELRELEEREGFENSLNRYQSSLHERFSAMIGLCQPGTSLPIARLKGYRAVQLKQPFPLDSFDDKIKNDFIVRMSSELLTKANETEQTFATLFLDALNRQDWRMAQEVGEILLEDDFNNPVLQKALPQLLSSTLMHRPNPVLAERLPKNKDATPSSKVSVVTWKDVSDCLKTGNFDPIKVFGNPENRPNIEDVSAETLSQALSHLHTLIEDLFTDDSGKKHILVGDTVSLLLNAIIEDIVADTEFPRQHFTHCHRQLMESWGLYHQGAVGIREGGLLLTLASGLLELDGTHSDDIFKTLKDWWDARKIPLMLPFLSEALDLLIQYAPDTEGLLELWIDGAAVAEKTKGFLSPVEYSVWYETGSHLGLDDDLKSYLGPSPEDIGTTVTDPIRSASLSKIAIVTLKKAPAQSAAKIIGDRCNAKVSIVIEKVAGSGTENAKTADVILFVWSCSKHAVYRAFDGVKDKIEYVQGTGTHSIVRALERYIIRNK